MSNKAENKGISALDFFCVGFGSIVGVGWALSINRWIANSGGPLPASLGYILALIVMVPVSLCYCELAPMMPVAGGGTAYAYRAFNEKIAFISGWAAFGGFVTIIPWEAIYICDVLSIMIPPVKGPLLYSLMDGEIYLGHIIFGTIFSCLLFYVNWRGATTSAVFQRVITIVLVGAGILGMIAALVHFDANNFKGVVATPEQLAVLKDASGTTEFAGEYAKVFLSGAEPTSFYSNVARGTHSSFFAGAVATLAAAPFFLAGFETIPQAVEDAKGDITSVGKTVVLSVGLACVFYALLLFCFGSAMPWQEFWKGGVFGSPAGGLLFTSEFTYGASSAIGQIMYYVILIGTLCGLFSTWNGFMMASPRLLMGMARGYMMPRALAKQNKYGTPSNGLIACFVLSLAGPFLGMALVDTLTLFAGAGFICSWGITSWSVVSLRKKEPSAERPYMVPGGNATAGFAGVIMILLFIMMFLPFSPTYLEPLPIILFVCWMVLGLILYLIAGSARKTVSADERAASLFERR